MIIEVFMINDFNALINYQCALSETPSVEPASENEGVISTLYASAFAILPYIMTCISSTCKLNTFRNTVIKASKNFKKRFQKKEAIATSFSKKEIKKLIKNRKSKQSKFTRIKNHIVSCGKDAIELGIAGMDVGTLAFPNKTVAGIVLAKTAVENSQKSKELFSKKNKLKLEITAALLKASGNAGKLVSLATDAPNELKLVSIASDITGSALGFSQMIKKRIQKLA